MKAIFTIVIILFAGAIALAQNPKQHDKVDTIEMGIVMVGSLTDSSDTKTVSITTETSIARLYRNKNSRVNSALAFLINRNYGKLA